jgi:NPCBM/NEW2 domain
MLTYDLSGRYSTFEALVGFDDGVKGKGRVVADGKELYANPDFRADGPTGQTEAAGRGGRAIAADRGFRSWSGYG